MIRYREGHKNSDGELAPWCIVSHENGRVISSHKSKSAAEKHLKDIQMFKHMKNESVLSDVGFKNRVVDILSRFDQFESKIWRRGGRYITINFRTAEYEGAVELAKAITRTLNDQLKGYRAELVGTGSVDDKWFADIKFRKLGETMKENINEGYRSEKWEEFRKIDTGLKSDLDKAIIESVFGQLSDGMWENSPRMNHYWPFIDVEKEGGKVVLKVSNVNYSGGYSGNGFIDMSDDLIKTWLAKKIKAVIKDEGLDWRRDNTDTTDYLSTDWRLPSKEEATVADCYYVYEVLRGRNVAKHSEYASKMSLGEAIEVLKSSGITIIRE